MANTTEKTRKIFDLKSWVELSEAAHYLTNRLGESVGQDDILQLGLEGHLTLSVRFPSGVSAHCGKTIPIDEAERTEIPDLSGEGTFVSINGTVIPGAGSVIVYEAQIRTISDVWDLPMFGGERLTVENLYERLCLRDEPELFNLEGTFVKSPDGIYCKLMERFEGERASKPGQSPYDPQLYYPAASLPEDSIIVVRTDALRDFAARIGQDPPANSQRPLQARERTTLLTVIAALARMAKIDVSRPSSAATAIESETARMGARVAARTIENHLKAIPAALEDRSG